METADEGGGESSLVFILSPIATIITIAVFLSPWKTVQEIQATKNVGSLSCNPFISTFMNCLLWITYGYLSANNTVLFVNCVGLSTSVYYIYVFYTNISRLEKDKLNKTLIMAGVIISAVYFYGFVMTGENDVVFNMGVFASVFSIIMFGAPLEKMVTVIRTKSTESMIFPLALMSFVCALSWSFYGYLIGDKFVLIPNAMASVLSALQLALFVLYPSRQGQPATPPLPLSYDKV